jgi:hypothetical protein
MSEGWEGINAARQKSAPDIDGVYWSPEQRKKLNALCAELADHPKFQDFLGYLRALTIECVEGDSVNPQSLVHREGQRWLVKLIEGRIESGRRDRSIAKQPRSGSSG